MDPALRAESSAELARFSAYLRRLALLTNRLDDDPAQAEQMREALIHLSTEAANAATIFKET